MPTLIHAAVVAAAFIGLIGHASAEVGPPGTESALQVRSWCAPIVNAQVISDGRFRAQARTEETGFCWGAFAVTQQFSRYTDGSELELHICLPAETTRRQLVMIFARYVDEHPETAHEHFADIAARALKLAFPCSQ